MVRTWQWNVTNYPPDETVPIIGLAGQTYGMNLTGDDPINEGKVWFDSVDRQTSIATPKNKGVMNDLWSRFLDGTWAGQWTFDNNDKSATRLWNFV